MLVPCEVCGRHLRPRESRCPFCDATRAPADTDDAAMPPRLSRAALLVAGSMVMAGCPLAVRYGGPPPPAYDPAPTPPPAAARSPDAASNAPTANTPSAPGTPTP
jgi:hypothetical protein